MKRDREKRARVKRAFVAMSAENARALQLRFPDLFDALVTFLDGPEIDALRDRVAAARAAPRS